MLLAPHAALAQASIAGVVKDVSGAVLPGVTVEAASPALIEKTRSVVTDGAGQYKVVDLRPGTYAVTFTLAGFNTVKREGVELAGSVVASVNAELKIGSVAETITVTGETPVVDVQSTQQQRVLGKETLDAIPNGRRLNSLAVLMPGVSVNAQDVGGTSDILSRYSIHGGRPGDSRFTVDGLSPSNGEGTGENNAYLPNMAAAQEVTIDTAGSLAEQGQGGVRINLIPREGGNTFKGSFFGVGANGSLQSVNYTDALKAAGLTSPDKLIKTYVVNPGLGGPLVKDKLWFFVAANFDGSRRYVGNTFFNKNAGNPNAWTYVPDPSQGQPQSANYSHSLNGRLTWQANAKNKFSLFYDDQTRCQGCPRLASYQPGSPVPSPDAAAPNSGWPMNRFVTLTWSSPLTGRLLVEAGVANHGEGWHFANAGDLDLNMIGVMEQSTGFSYRNFVGNPNVSANPFSIASYRQNLNNLRGSVSYITGSHAFKVGMMDGWGSNDRYTTANNYGLWYRFNNGLPNQLTMYATPYPQATYLNADLGVYAQDRWTINRLTLNLGVRFDYFNLGYQALHLGPGPLVPTRNLDLPDGPLMSWKDITPRLAAAYDVFGNGKTAVKVSLNKYVQGAAVTTNQNLAPVNLLANVTARSWNDSNGNFTPDCNLLNPATNGECGAMANQNFGKAQPTTVVDPATLNGWGARPYNWEFSASVQQQVLPRVSIEAGYFRRLFGGFTVTDNQLVAASDYTQFGITAPVDARLPNGGGNVIAGLYDLNPNKVGQVSNYVTFASNYGDQTEHWNGLDLSVNARPRGGVLLQGGISTGRTITDNCAVVAQVPELSPLTAPYCHQNSSFVTQLKVIGSYTIPKADVQVSGALQSVPGPVLAANFNAPNAVVQPSLGRPLSGNAPNATVNLVAPGAMYGDRINQLDVRFGKVFKVRNTRTMLGLDLYNALNINSVTSESSAYAVWRAPLAIIDPRIAKVSLQFDF
ncbi:MAG: carboxypeptidase regulatory-like domain-containing protein [Acidobacteriota bacterium]